MSQIGSMAVPIQIPGTERTRREEAKKRQLGAILDASLKRGEMCGICYENLNPRSACILRCHHIWCEECILSWSKELVGFTERRCPLCRRAIRSYYKRAKQADSTDVTRAYCGEPGYPLEADMSLD